MTTYQNILRKRDLAVPGAWRQLRTIDMHTGGEPLRVIVSGYPKLEGRTVLEYRRNCIDRHDNLRKLLIHEPRGHNDMYGCLLTPPNDASGDFGVVFLHNEGYSTMCGHAILALATLAVTLEWIQVSEGNNSLKIDTPCGRIEAMAVVKNGKLQETGFLGVPSFVVGLDRSVEVPGVGTVIYDLAYGGAFYAYVDLRKNELGLRLQPDALQELVRCGMTIKRAVAKDSEDIRHPFEHDLGFLYGTIFIGASSTAGMHSKNVCVFADGEVDRSPTGSGLSGRMAIHWARKEIIPGEIIAVESITGSVFRGSVASEVEYGGYRAIIPHITGSAFVTGMHNFVIDPEDPFQTGFILR